MDVKKFKQNLIEIDEEYERLADDKYWIGDKFKEILRECDYKSNGIMYDKLMSYFINTFEGISSNSRVLLKDTEPKKWSDSPKETITIGKFGFGIKPYGKSKPVNNLEGIKILKKKLPEVIKKLEGIRKWKKANELKSFFELVDIEKYERQDIITINISKVELLNTSRSYIEEDAKPVRVYDILKIYLSQEHVSILLFNSEMTGQRSFDIRYISKDRYIDYGNMLANFELDSQLPKILSIFKKEVSLIAERKNKLLEECDKIFGRYIMANNL